MRTLDEAWNWYVHSRRLLKLMRRVADRYWLGLPWSEMERDENFRALESEDVINSADMVLAEFDDIAVFVLFSVFEAIVRDHVLNELTEEVALVKHPALAKAAKALKGNIEEGSFYNNVLDLYKDVNHNLVEHVNQVRTYRNWVAHGRRRERKRTNVTPRTAIDCLREFLVLIGHRAPRAVDDPPPPE
jgi:hypothetical protein